eukprot:scaffold218368_cov27-Tisochrysis_lutea.AAC.3
MTRIDSAGSPRRTLATAPCPSASMPPKISSSTSRLHETAPRACANCAYAKLSARPRRRHSPPDNCATVRVVLLPSERLTSTSFRTEPRHSRCGGSPAQTSAFARLVAQDGVRALRESRPPVRRAALSLGHPQSLPSLRPAAVWRPRYEERAGLSRCEARRSSPQSGRTEASGIDAPVPISRSRPQRGPSPPGQLWPRTVPFLNLAAPAQSPSLRLAPPSDVTVQSRPGTRAARFLAPSHSDDNAHKRRASSAVRAARRLAEARRSASSASRSRLQSPLAHSFRIRGRHSCRDPRRAPDNSARSRLPAALPPMWRHAVLALGPQALQERPSRIFARTMQLALV